uniref:Uncharacterized protein n=1 Tax=Panagrolaimus superbus TaxID=310955 RepID=A0A914YWT8_9BILA
MLKFQACKNMAPFLLPLFPINQPAGITIKDDSISSSMMPSFLPEKKLRDHPDPPSQMQMQHSHLTSSLPSTTPPPTPTSTPTPTPTELSPSVH